MKNSTVTIIAGPCSISEENQGQLFEIAELTVPVGATRKRAIWGVRVVGLKSRTALSSTGAGMGIDFPAYERNLERFLQGASVHELEIPPSVSIAKTIVEKTGVIAATEIVDPLMQLPPYEREVPKGSLFVWNPAVNQLGHAARVMGMYAARNGWYHGFKNGKWLGDVPAEGGSTMERSWAGLTSYALEGMTGADKNRAVLIHRGVDIAGKGEYRNVPVHEAAIRVKESLGMKLFFDPSHTHGPSLKHRIVEETLAALTRTTSSGAYVYDGLLLEVGDSVTDTEQHITIEELRELAARIATFRDLALPGTPL